jgi:hypothetical protein
MILTFKKIDGRNLGIDIDVITEITDMGHCRIIGTVADEYEVLDSYWDVVKAVNSLKSPFAVKFIHN